MTDAQSNIHEFSVSELAQSLKRTVEDVYGHVRVRGELGRVTIAKSGHCYLDIKDDRAVINSIIWKGNMMRLGVRPEEGMEVVVEGKMSTYPGRSNYQLIIEKLELAGAGALMALFEKRKAAFREEGLFDSSRKMKLPFMPKTIGVVTSPTGAVIRDILHRITDRFPVHVIVWPVLVQGDKAADQISAAITGFNHADGFPRPDVLVVARGGGSLEDLWCFNEENVVRAAANSDIPLISAVGHETDWTLIDFVSDYRAPTPTGAAEVAVPVREEYLTLMDEYAVRLKRAQRRNIEGKSQYLRAARLPRLDMILSVPQQRLDLASTGLTRASNITDPFKQKLALLTARLNARSNLTDFSENRLQSVSSRLIPALVEAPMTRLSEKLQRISGTLGTAAERRLADMSTRLERSAGLLEAYSYQGVLARGYALVTANDGSLVRSTKSVSDGDQVTLTFADGTADATIDKGGPVRPPKKKSPPAPKADQGDLF